MSEYITNATLQEIATALDQANTIAITTHAKPDGDAIGSTLALQRALSRRGKDVDCFLMGPIEPAIESIIGDTHVIHITEDNDVTPHDNYDRIIVVDTGAWSQLRALRDWLGGHRPRIIVLDHHARGDDVGAMRWIDTAAASTTQIVLELFDTMGITFTRDDPDSIALAEPLFVGLATDTGWFRHANGNARAFETAARLLALGVDKTRLYQTIEETHRPARLGLLARALTSLAFVHDHTVAVMTLTPEDFAATGGTISDLTGMVNQPMEVGAVRIGILITATDPGRTKISFRSKPPISSDAPLFDVNELAQHFGGGGHIHAAGASVDRDIETVRPELFALLQTAVSAS